MKRTEAKQAQEPETQAISMDSIGKMKSKELARIARLALDMLHTRALQGSDPALDALWQAGMVTAERLQQFTMDNELGGGERIRKLAGKKLVWPFKLHAISEFRSGKDGSSNPEEFMELIGLGNHTRIKLNNPKPKKGETRIFRAGTPASLALRARREIEVDSKRYLDKSDREISSGRYHTWKVGDGEATGKTLQANRKKLLEYVKAIRAIKNLSDKTQWMNAADLWLVVAFEGKPDDRPFPSQWTRGRWPKSLYEYADNNRKSVQAVLSQRLIDGFSVIITPPSAKTLLG